nr:hypothetical protein [Tanacetum cinerariifolium]
VEDDDDDPEEDPSKEHEPEVDDEDPEEDPNEEHEAEDASYVRALQASERRMMTSIEEVNLRVSYQAQARARADTVEDVDSGCKLYFHF